MKGVVKIELIRQILLSNAPHGLMSGKALPPGSQYEVADDVARTMIKAGEAKLVSGNLEDLGPVEVDPKTGVKRLVDGPETTFDKNATHTSDPAKDREHAEKEGRKDGVRSHEVVASDADRQDKANRLHGKER